MRLHILAVAFLAVICHATLIGQTPYLNEVRSFQLGLNLQYAAGDDSPLSEEQQEEFKALGGHIFFPIDSSYRVEAHFEIFENPDTIHMKTSTTRIADYFIYGKATFILKGEKYSLYIYQNQRLMNMEEYKNYLFLPFNDLSNGVASYGGGRYMDLEIPEDKTKIILDFNKTYHPYCAYSDNYSCPIPPVENFLNIDIQAGIKLIEITH